MYFSNQIVKLSVDEYSFLTENFEFINKEEIEAGVKYIIFNRKRNIIDTVKKVLQNELKEMERNLVLDYWGNNLSVDELADKYEISRATVYRCINNSKKKIEKFIKYVLVYDDTVRSHSVEDFLGYIKGESIEN